MVQENGLFIVAENEIYNEEEVFSVGEDEPAHPPVGAPSIAKVEEKPKGWLNTRDVGDFPQFVDDEFVRLKKPHEVRTSLSATEQALGQWKDFNKHFTNALSNDYHGKLDALKLDQHRSKVEQYIDDLDRIRTSYINLKKNKRADAQHEIVKEATTPKYLGMQTNMTLFERAIVGALINGVVSGGRNMEELYALAKKKYELSDREELAVFQALTDLGYPTFKDRLRVGDDSQDPDGTNIGEWQSQYYS
jgi:hypothetical protein